MSIEFDPAKDESNRRTHGMSLARAVDFDVRALLRDERRDYGEDRYRAFGMIDGLPHAMVFTMRGDVVRIISLRRAHRKEYQRHVRSQD